MIDCHTHLFSREFDRDREEVLSRAQAAGVSRIAVVGQDAPENETLLRMTDGDSRYLCFLGLHPDRFADRRAMMDAGEVDRTLAMIRSACSISSTPDPYISFPSIASFPKRSISLSQ